MLGWREYRDERLRNVKYRVESTDGTDELGSQIGSVTASHSLMPIVYYDGFVKI